MIITEKRACRRLCAILVGVAAALLPALSFGYVLPAPYIMEQMVVNMGLPEKYQVEQSIRIEKESDNGDQLFDKRQYEQTVRYLIPGMFRSDISGDDISHIHISVPTASVTAIDEVIISESEPWLYGYRELFSYRTRETLTDRLSDMGIDVDIASIGRLDRKTICYVIGAQYPDMGVAQLWIERDTYLPVKLIVKGSASPAEKPAGEIRFLNWKQFDGMKYPGEITFIEYGNVVQKIVVKRVGINAGFESDIFDIRAFKEGYVENEGQLHDVTDEIHQEIEQFKRIFE